MISLCRTVVISLTVLAMLDARGEDVAGQHFEATTTSDGVAVFPDVANRRTVTFEVPVYSITAGPFEIRSPDNDLYFEINGNAITQVFFKERNWQLMEKT